jgi:WD40 repeat protein
VIKSFKGHTDTISNLIMNPKDDTFLTTSNDNTMRIWNLNSKNQGIKFDMQSVIISSMFRRRACLPSLLPALTLLGSYSQLLGPNNKRINRWSESASTEFKDVKLVLSLTGARTTIK